jgi:hypothetical protein
VLQHDDSTMVRCLLREMARVTRQSIYLFEDVTGPVRIPDAIRQRVASCRPRPGSHPVRRPVGDYVEVLTEAGFPLQSRQTLPVMVSEGVCQVARRLLPAQPEGAAVPRSVVLAQRAFLPMTRQLDRLISPLSGLCQMTFGRVQPVEERRKSPTNALATPTC